MDVTSPTALPRLPVWLEPVAGLGHAVIAGIGYVGGVAGLLAAALSSVFQVARDEGEAGFWRVTKAQLWWLLVTGVPLVGLVHVGMGSFLSLQAYFGSTFVEGTGAVVGVGLVRNLAPLMTGLTLSGLIACRFIGERIETEPSGALAGGLDPGRAAAPRIAAAAVATTLLSLWGAAVGTLVGWQCADAMMGLSYETFFMMFYRMIWFRDVLGIVFKGVLFGVLPALICCHEGLRLAAPPTEIASGGPPSGGGRTLDRASGPLLRGTCLSMASVLLVNMTWFLLVYHAVPVYGPSLLNPPTP
jgi:phospholipid/cholesterol/gamma-HCH transport system permease protein